MQIDPNNTPPVAMARIPAYESPELGRTVALLLETTDFRPGRGERVLVKPNLVSQSNARHCCTDAAVVRAACTYLLDCGVSVMVADSPGYGPASKVAQQAGIGQAVNELGLKVTSLGHAVPLKLSGAGSIGLSREALEADRILNLPKLKVHCQMTMSGAVKNLFGCVVGFRKALAHNRLGHSHEVFRSMLMDVYEALPRTHHLMDGIHTLHKDGPVSGEPYPLGLLAASKNGVALDTAAYTIFKLTPEQLPLWEEALKRGMPGAVPSDITYPLERPDRFSCQGFTMSKERPLDFRFTRLVKGRFRSLLKYFKK